IVPRDSRRILPRSGGPPMAGNAQLALHVHYRALKRHDILEVIDLYRVLHDTQFIWDIGVARLGLREQTATKAAGALGAHVDHGTAVRDLVTIPGGTVGDGQSEIQDGEGLKGSTLPGEEDQPLTGDDLLHQPAGLGVV